MKKLVALVFAFWVPLAHASEWMHLFNTDAEEYYIDLESIKPTNSYNKDTIKSWFRVDIFKDVVKDGMAVGDKTYVLYTMDCKYKKLGLTQGIRYKNGKQFGTNLNMPNPLMKDAIPDSNGDEMLSKACSIYEIQNGTRSYMQNE